MKNQDEHIKQLNYKLDILLMKQTYFAKEIESLRAEINSFKLNMSGSFNEVDNHNNTIETTQSPKISQIDEELEAYLNQKADEIEETTHNKHSLPSLFDFDINNLEKFIGENLINKIGILITIIGVGIGTKYSIEHELIMPLTRIILGYLLGIGLLITGIKLKERYLNYSAVLVSGAMAIMYIISFVAYSRYQLLSQEITFLLMVIFTIFTVIAALIYNRQIIAVIGMVGAYAIPFLLSNNSGNMAFMFAYMSIINIGILVIAVKKYWQQLYYLAFIFTWLIFLSWFITKYHQNTDTKLSLGFASLFFILFYTTFLAYKLINKTKFQKFDVFLLLSNAFVFFSIGYRVIYFQDNLKTYIGLFTLLNAIVHGIVSYIFYRNKAADKNLFYLAIGLALVFLTIAVPIQLSGKWITLLWIGEAGVLYWIGSSKNISFYRKMAYPLLGLAFISLLIDWETAQNNYTDANTKQFTALLNTDFLNSLLFVIGLGFINYNKFKYRPQLKSVYHYKTLLSTLIPLLFIFVLYMMFRLEIEHYWEHLIAKTRIKTNYSHYKENIDLQLFKTIWIDNYSLLFTGLLGIINIKKIKNYKIGIFNLGLIALSIFVFLTQGLYEISELRNLYLHQKTGDVFVKDISYLTIRYISLLFLIFDIYIIYLYRKQGFMSDLFKNKKQNNIYEIALSSIVLWVSSSELLHWMAIANNEQNYKLGLSLFWGFFALILVGIGIRYNKKHLRIFAISLFGGTLLKVFFYDLASLNTLSKTIVFVALGVLLLIISFLYNKFKDIINDENNN